MQVSSVDGKVFDVGACATENGSKLVIDSEWTSTTKSCACGDLGQKCALATIVQVNGLHSQL